MSDTISTLTSFALFAVCVLFVVPDDEHDCIYTLSHRWRPPDLCRTDGILLLLLEFASVIIDRNFMIHSDATIPEMQCFVNDLFKIIFIFISWWILSVQMTANWIITPILWYIEKYRASLIIIKLGFVETLHTSIASTLL